MLLLLLWLCGSLSMMSVMAMSEKSLSVGEILLFLIFGLFAPFLLLIALEQNAGYKVWKHPTYRD